MTEAGELGCETGRQAKHYWELAEHVVLFQYRMADEINRALKLFMIGIRGGYHQCLNQIQEMYSLGQATKDDYAKALCRAYQVRYIWVKLGGVIKEIRPHIRMRPIHKSVG